MRVLFAGGGTAGHVNPALAIAKYIQGRKPNAEIAFVGTKEGIEASLIPKEGFPIFFIDVHGFKRKISLYNVGALKRAVTSMFEADTLLKEWKPDIVVGTGGYVSGPVLYRAAKMNIPTVIHEQNAFPGITSRMLSRVVDRVLISFEESRSHLKKGRGITLTGNPIREEMILRKKQEAREKLGLDERPYVVSFAGSLGAREINKTMIAFLQKIKDEGEFQFLHSTGERGWLWMPEKIKEAGIEIADYPHLQVKEYIYNMPDAMAAADLLICRSGAITLGEIAAMNKAAILIPSPNVTNNHQYYNALAFSQAQAAVVIEEKDLTPERLYEEVTGLIRAPQRIRDMEAAAAKLAIYDSTEKIYDVICQLSAK